MLLRKLYKIDTTTTHKDLSILFDECLKFHDHTTEVAAKVNKVFGIVIEHLDFYMVSKLFTTLIRPILEYGNPICDRICEKGSSTHIQIHELRGLQLRLQSTYKPEIFRIY